MSHYNYKGSGRESCWLPQNRGGTAEAGEGTDRQTGLGDGDELVADAALADDAPGGLRVVLQLLAEAADVHLQVIDLVGILAAPHLGQQGVVRQHPSRVAGQMVEEGVFGW